MAGKLWSSALWAGGLFLCNLVVYRFSPHPFAISGNGFHPMQLFGLLGAMVCAVGLVVAVMGWGARLAGAIRPQVRNLAVIGALAVSVLLLLFAWKFFQEFDWYFKRLDTDHRWPVLNQYTVAYWATSCQFWLGVLGLGLTAGIMRAAPHSSKNTKV